MDNTAPLPDNQNEPHQEPFNPVIPQQPPLEVLPPMGGGEEPGGPKRDVVKDLLGKAQNYGKHLLGRFMALSKWGKIGMASASVVTGGFMLHMVSGSHPAPEVVQNTLPAMPVEPVAQAPVQPVHKHSAKGHGKHAVKHSKKTTSHKATKKSSKKTKKTAKKKHTNDTNN